jgi:polar amino acid transport system permease protein
MISSTRLGSPASQEELGLVTGQKLLPIDNKIRSFSWTSALITTLVGLFILLIAWGFVSSENISWETIGKYLFDARILGGLVNTIALTIAAMIIGTLCGLVIAVFAMSRNPVLRFVSVMYVWIFRGTPLLVQLVFWFNLGLIFPMLWFGIPGTDLGVGVATNTVMTGFMAALLGLGLNEGAILAEVIRGGITAVESGQREGAQALGLNNGQILRKVVLPQAVRVMIPPYGNNLIYMLKNTSMVSVIAGSDLLSNVQQIYSNNFKVVELLTVASIWYLVLTSVATFALAEMEIRMTRRGWAVGDTRNGPIGVVIRHIVKRRNRVKRQSVTE